MKYIIKKYLSRILLFSACALNVSQVSTMNQTSVVSLLKIRPQSLNGARKVAGEVPHLVTYNVANTDVWYSHFSLTPAYQRTFDTDTIARTLFDGYLQKDLASAHNSSNKSNKACNTTILIQGSDVTARNSLAWRAEDFYLSSTYDGALSFNPTISNFILDFNFYGELNHWVQGLYFRVYAPFVHTKWHLNMKETIITAGNTTSINKPFAAASAFFAGATPSHVALPSVDYLVSPGPSAAFPVTRNPLESNKMIDINACITECANNSDMKNGFGELRAECGWNFWQQNNCRLGAYIAAAAPTGNRPQARFLFEPLIGNGKHGELGGGLTAHWAFWNSECENHIISVNFDTLVTHLFTSRQRRTFDLKDKPLSRYMLAAKMRTSPTNFLLGTDAAGNTTPPPVQFANVFTPVANLTTQDVNISVGAQVDLTAWFTYTGSKFNIDFGYNLWLQTAEKFSCASQCGPRLAVEKNTWVLVGDAEAYGITPNPIPNVPLGQQYTFFYPLSFSESKATLHSPTNNGGNNATIDNPQIATYSNGPQPLFSLHSDTNNPILAHLSNPPIFINEVDINMNQCARALSNKLFANVGYTWNSKKIMFSVNIGGEAEFGSSRGCPKNVTPATTTTTNNNCKKSCTSCIESAVSQWGVWAKFDISV